MACLRSLAIAVLVTTLTATGLRADATDESAAQAPRFKIRSVSGKTLDLQKLLAKGPVLLDFWATWCKPCLAAIPELVKLDQELRPRGLTVIGISTDGPNNFAKVRPLANRLGVRYPVAIDEDGVVADQYLIRAMPTTVLIDRTGAVVRVQQGYRPGEGEALRAAVLRALGDAAAPGGKGVMTTPEAGAPHDTSYTPPVPADSTGGTRRP